MPKSEICKPSKELEESVRGRAFSFGTAGRGVGVGASGSGAMKERRRVANRGLLERVGKTGERMVEEVGKRVELGELDLVNRGE